MSEENIQQTEQVVEKEDSLDQITKDFGIEDQAKEFRQQVAPVRQEVQQPQITQANIPDPLDTEAHKAYLAKIEQNQSSLQQTLEKTIGTISAYEQKAQRESLEADIAKAVKTANEIINHPKPKMVEVALELRAQEDKKFKAIWDNRQKNPQALERAIKIVAREIAEDFSIKVDPDLVKSQRALKLSQQQTATTKREEPENEWSGLDEQEFSQKWNRMVSGGY
jgi:hypothetical protein